MDGLERKGIHSLKRTAILLLLSFGMLFANCSRSLGPESNVGNADVHLRSSCSFLRVGDSTEIVAELDTDDRLTCTYEWSTSAGCIESAGEKVRYVAPSTSDTARITVCVTLGDGSSCHDTLSIVIYRQFIILKADDLVAGESDAVPSRWRRFIEHIFSKNIKASLGLIGSSLEKDNRDYFSRLEDLDNSGCFEIWNHGYDHLLNGRNEGGEVIHEFFGTSYEHQKEHLLRTQRLAKEKLHITLRTFGAPGNAIDHTTLEAIEETEDIKIWLFGLPASSTLVLERSCEIEFPTHNPDYGQFLQQCDAERDYLVFQIHPNGWDDSAFYEFERIIDYLIESDATFITPHEYYTLLCGY